MRSTLTTASLIAVIFVLPLAGCKQPIWNRCQEARELRKQLRDCKTDYDCTALEAKVLNAEDACAATSSPERQVEQMRERTRPAGP